MASSAWAQGGQLLRRYRHEAGLTQEALAERAGYSTVYISMLERGQRVPAPATIDTLSDALDLSAVERAVLQDTVRPRHVTERPPLVGRERELEVLQVHLAGTGPPVLAFAGDPGIGKSTVLQAASRLASARGMAVLQGGAARRGGEEPYAPLAGVLTRHLHGLDAAQRAAVLEGCAWLTRVLPELRSTWLEPTDTALLTPGAEQRLIVDALHRFLARIAGPGGTVLVLDDLQWATADALTLLAALLRLDPNVRIVTAYRDVEVAPEHPLDTFLGELVQARLITRVHVQPLSPAAADELLVHVMRGERGHRDDIVRRAAGVPLYLVSYAEAIHSGSVDPQRELPWDIVQSVRQRVDDLSDEAREILSTATIVGRQVSRRTLAAATGHADRRLAEALDRLCRSGLLQEESDGSYRFSHDIVREVIERDLSAARRAALHRRVGEVLEAESDGTALEALAFHFARSDDVTRALTYLERAGDAARARDATATAEGYYRERADLLDDLGRTRDAVAAREKLGHTLAAGGKYDAALQMLEGVAKAYRAAGETVSEARVLAAIGRIHYLCGTAEGGIPHLEAVSGVVRDPEALAVLYAALAPLYMAAQQYEEQRAAAERASTLARDRGDVQRLAEAEVWRGCALNQLGRIEEGRAVLESAVALAEEAGDLVSLTHALNDLAFLSEIGGELLLSRRWKLRALAVAERAGDRVAIANMLFRCGQNAWLCGETTQARSWFERSLALARETGAGSPLPYPLFGLALLASSEGHWEMAVTLATESRDAARACGDMKALAAAESVLAEYDLVSGKPEDALRRLEPFAATNGMDLRGILPIMAEAALAMDDVVTARHLIDSAVTLAERRGSRIGRLEALPVAVRLAARTGRWDEAANLLEEGLLMARAMPCPKVEVELRDLAATLGAPRRPSALQRVPRRFAV